MLLVFSNRNSDKKSYQNIQIFSFTGLISKLDKITVELSRFRLFLNLSVPLQNQSIQRQIFPSSFLSFSNLSIYVPFRSRCSQSRTVHPVSFRSLSRTVSSSFRSLSRTVSSSFRCLNSNIYRTSNFLPFTLFLGQI